MKRFFRVRRRKDPLEALLEQIKELRSEVDQLKGCSASLQRDVKVAAQQVAEAEANAELYRDDLHFVEDELSELYRKHEDLKAQVEDDTPPYYEKWIAGMCE